MVAGLGRSLRARSASEPRGGRPQPKDRGIAMVFRTTRSIRDRIREHVLRPDRLFAHRNPGPECKAATILELSPFLKETKDCLVGSASAWRWARDRARAGIPVRRAALEPGREAARADARRLQSLHRRLGTTSLYVTRPGRGDDARRRMIVMNAGRAEQIGRSSHAAGDHLCRGIHRLIPMNLIPRSATDASASGVRPEHASPARVGGQLVSRST